MLYQFFPLKLVFTPQAAVDSTVYSCILGIFLWMLMKFILSQVLYTNKSPYFVKRPLIISFIQYPPSPPYTLIACNNVWHIGGARYISHTSLSFLSCYDTNTTNTHALFLNCISHCFSDTPKFFPVLLFLNVLHALVHQWTFFLFSKA